MGMLTRIQKHLCGRELQRLLFIHELRHACVHSFGDETPVRRFLLDLANRSKFRPAQCSCVFLRFEAFQKFRNSSVQWHPLLSGLAALAWCQTQLLQVPVVHGRTRSVAGSKGGSDTTVTTVSCNRLLNLDLKPATNKYKSALFLGYLNIECLNLHVQGISFYETGTLGCKNVQTTPIGLHWFAWFGAAKPLANQIGQNPKQFFMYPNQIGYPTSPVTQIPKGTSDPRTSLVTQEPVTQERHLGDTVTQERIQIF